MAINRRHFLSRLGVLATGLTTPLVARAVADPSTRPLQILLIRHAEEPARGVSEDLDAHGRRRAAALATLFTARFVTPQFLFAAQSSSRSNRSVETLEPLARTLAIPINRAFKSQHYGDLAHALLTQAIYDHSRVLICWHHSSLPELALALGVKKPPPGPGPNTTASG